MEEFKVRKIIEDHNRFLVEIEFLKSGDRRKFGYPYGDGWEEETDGEPKFLTHIKELLQRDENSQKDKKRLLNLKNFEGLVSNKKA